MARASVGSNNAPTSEPQFAAQQAAHEPAGSPMRQSRPPSLCFISPALSVAGSSVGEVGAWRLPDRTAGNSSSPHGINTQSDTTTACCDVLSNESQPLLRAAGHDCTGNNPRSSNEPERLTRSYTPIITEQQQQQRHQIQQQHTQPSTTTNPLDTHLLDPITPNSMTPQQNQQQQTQQPHQQQDTDTQDIRTNYPGYAWQPANDDDLDTSFCTNINKNFDLTRLAKICYKRPNNDSNTKTPKN